MSEARIRPGQPARLEAQSPSGSSLVVLEDDGETGYLYALVPGRDGRPAIADAVQVYIAPASGAASAEVGVRLEWSADGERCGLTLDGELQAVFDFRAQLGACRSGFPPPVGWRRERARSAGELAALLATG